MTTSVDTDSDCGSERCVDTDSDCGSERCIDTDSDCGSERCVDTDSDCGSESILLATDNVTNVKSKPLPAKRQKTRRWCGSAKYSTKYKKSWKEIRFCKALEPF